MKLEKVSCPLCGSSESQQILQVPSFRLPGADPVFDLQECAQCRMVFTSPRPVPEEMAKLYGPAFYFTKDAPWMAFINRSVARQRVRFTRQCKTSGNVLDVGCGTGGYLLEMARAGFQVHGLEPYQSVLDHVPASLKNSIHVQPFEEVSLPENSFDVVTLWHVLEHLPQPLEMLRKVRGFLKTDGVLILEVPNFASGESRWLGRHWPHLDVPYHFWHWTPQTLEQAVRQAGYQSVEMRTDGGLHPLTILNFLLLGANSVEKWLGENRKGLERFFRRLHFSKGLSVPLLLMSRIRFSQSPPMMRLVARKS